MKMIALKMRLIQRFDQNSTLILSSTQKVTKFTKTTIAKTAIKHAVVMLAETTTAKVASTKVMYAQVNLKYFGVRAQKISATHAIT